MKISRPRHIRRVRKHIELYRPKYQLNRMKWEFHAYDDDPFPSVPHGHSVNSVHKLHVHSGDIYKGKNVCGTIKKKELDRLWSDERFIKFVEIAKQFHEQKQKQNVRLRGKMSYKWRRTRRRPIFTFISEVELHASEQDQ
jgi:hypothetical protein